MPFETVVFAILKTNSVISCRYHCVAAIIDAFLLDLLAAPLFTILVGCIPRGRRRIAQHVNSYANDNGYTGGDDQDRYQGNGST
jgi:hypothetical protein